MTAKTTRITVEKETIMLVRDARAEQAWCAICCGYVDVATLDKEALAEFFASKDVQQWMADGRLHVSHQPNGPIQICLVSLLQCFEP